jgi:drug/metabolite transporter (DMT)-like permease
MSIKPFPLRRLRSSPALALFSLVGVTAVWGSTFVVVQDAVSRMPVMDFLAVRFTLASLVMLVLRPRTLGRFSREMLGRGALLGLALAGGYIFQTYGLLYTSAAVSGFITGMFVVLTPVLGWALLGKKPGLAVWLAAALAVVGLALISLRGWSVGAGELLTLACALSFALHIVGLGEWSSRHDIYALTLLQLVTVTAVSWAAALPDGLTLPPDGGVWIAIFITAVLATAVAFLVQTWAQSLVTATRTAVVMTMEPVFAGFFGVVLGGNNLTARIVLGAAFILAAMLLTELRPGRAVPPAPEKQ